VAHSLRSGRSGIDSTEYLDVPYQSPIKVWLPEKLEDS
jgi:hypothetical protein